MPPDHGTVTMFNYEDNLFWSAVYTLFFSPVKSKINHWLTANPGVDWSQQQQQTQKERLREESKNTVVLLIRGGDS